MDDLRTQEFCKKMGWKLWIQGRSENGLGTSATAKRQSFDCAEDYFVPQREDVEQVEQNLAFSCIEQTFEEEACTLYRKSLKNDSRGKYLELTFISPAVGQRFGEVLQNLSSQIGWRIRIADKVNQAELFKIAGNLCEKYGIAMCKNPSYLPLKKEIHLTVMSGSEEKKRVNMAEEFQKMTGCGCSFRIESFLQ